MHERVRSDADEQVGSNAIPGGSRAALIIAHPGHELRIHGWLARTRPVVFVLTDGSGAHGCSRLDSSTRLLERAGAVPGPIYGAVSDRELYQLILAGDVAWFEAMAFSLLDALLASQVEVVVADGLEGFNPAHDLCRHIVDTVVTQARTFGRSIQPFTFALDSSPVAQPDGTSSGCLRLELSDDELARKLAAARDYEGLDKEVQAALQRYGADAFRHEVLWPADAAPFAPADPPAYERYGENRQHAGTYREVIRHRDHIQPIVDALQRCAHNTGPYRETNFTHVHEVLSRGSITGVP